MERLIHARLGLLVLVLSLTIGATAWAEEQIGKSHKPTEKLASFSIPVGRVDPARTNHPLYPVLMAAEESLESIEKNVQDYTCKLVRRERIGGKLGKYEFISTKVRHEQTDGDSTSPFSVYLRFNKPAKVEGREALYVAGKHAGKVYVRRGGQKMSYVSSYIKPDSRLAMKENRYPITDIGFKRMVERLVNVIENDLQYDECEVKFYKGAKVNDRTCTRIEVVHPVEREHFRFHKAMIFLDDEDKLPVGYASFYWPRKKDEKPRLLEEYIYTDIELNVGLTDEDFDRDNPDYGFSRKRDKEE